MQAWILAIKAQASAANDRTAPPRADEDQKATPGDAPAPAPLKKRSSSFMGRSRAVSSPKDDAARAHRLAHAREWRGAKWTLISLISQI